MGLFKKKEGNDKNNIIIKPGLNYKEIKNQIRDFDLIVFTGSDFVSKTIMSLSKYELGKDAGHYSHVGMIITKNILDHPKMEDGELYIFESTMSGKLTDGVLNIEGESFLGSQIRKFDDVVKAYDSNPDTQVRWCKLLENPLDILQINDIRLTMAELFLKYNHRLYEVNIMNLFFAMFPSLRKFKYNYYDDNRFVFCSELAGIIYRAFFVIPFEANPTDIVPADFMVTDEDKMVNCKKWQPNLITYYK